MGKIALLTIALTLQFIPVTFADQVQLNTFYPSPYGVYQRIKLVGIDIVNGNSCLLKDVGTIAVDKINKNFLYCKPNGSTAGIWTSLQGYWTKSGNSVFLNTITDKVAIGTQVASSSLTIKASGKDKSTKSLDISNSENKAMLMLQDDGKLGLGVSSLSGPIEKLQVGDSGDAVNSRNTILLQGGANPYLSLKLAEFQSGANKQHGFQLQYDGQLNTLKLLSGSYSAGNPNADFPDAAMLITRNNPSEDSRIVIKPPFQPNNISQYQDIKNALEVGGSVAIGSGYSISGKEITAPNSLIIEGALGVGDPNPDEKLVVTGGRLGHVQPGSTINSFSNNNQWATVGNAYASGVTDTSSYGLNVFNGDKGVLIGMKNYSGGIWNSIIRFEDFASNQTNSLRFITPTNADAMVITAAGNVGVGGITAPTQSLHIKDVMRIQPRSTVPSGSAACPAPGVDNRGSLYVRFDGGNTTLCFCDGSSWQKIGGLGTCN